MCWNGHTFFFVLECFLRFVSDKQVPFWLQHPKSITTGIYRRHLSTWVTQLQIVLCQHHVNEPGEETRHEKEAGIYFPFFPKTSLLGLVILRRSLFQGVDGKLFPHAAIGPGPPRHVVILQLPSSFIKVFLHWAVFIQKAIELVFLKVNVFLIRKLNVWEISVSAVKLKPSSHLLTGFLGPDSANPYLTSPLGDAGWGSVGKSSPLINHSTNEHINDPITSRKRNYYWQHGVVLMEELGT